MLFASRAIVIQTASSGARISGEWVLDDLEHVRDFTMELNYSTTKLHNVMLKTAPSLHPGLTALWIRTEALLAGCVGGALSPLLRPEVSPMSNIEFVQEYSTFIESAMLDEQAFLAKLPHYITDESVLAEPDSIFGRLVGINGWNQWRTAAADMAMRTGVRFVTGGSQFFENGDTVLHYYEIDFSAREGYPGGWHTSIIERYDFAGGKIAKLSAYYADTTAFLKYFS